jgi:hypothetical protein
MIPGTDGETDSVFVFPGTGRVEASYDLKTWTTVLPAAPSNGIERTYREVVHSEKRFFRVR